MTVKTICDNFFIQGEFIGYQALSGGNINQTYLVTYLYSNKTCFYVLQKINKFVFKNPQAVMDNIVGVTTHVARKVQNCDNANRSVLKCIPLNDGENRCFVDDNGDFWRCYIYLSDSLSFDSPTNLKVIKEAGKAFGQFQKLLSDYDVNTLNITIPNFHNTKKRYEDFEKCVEIDLNKRRKKVEKEIEFIRSRRDYSMLFSNLLVENKIYQRVTHNDTKCNNVLFDKKTLCALTVVDLDTVMPGLTAYDYGDAIRSISSTVDEDEKRLDMIDFDLNKFEVFTAGFLEEVKDSLTKIELKTLADGVLIMTIELALRFLKDYIDGDVYFKTREVDHNLTRARNQIALAKKIEDKMPKIREIINNYC